jgi:hypothetical protein
MSSGDDSDPDAAPGIGALFDPFIDPPVGPALDALAANFGVSRNPGETDAALTQRLAGVAGIGPGVGVSTMTSAMSPLGPVPDHARYRRQLRVATPEDHARAEAARRAEEKDRQRIAAARDRALKRHHELNVRERQLEQIQERIRADQEQLQRERDELNAARAESLATELADDVHAHRVANDRTLATAEAILAAGRRAREGDPETLPPDRTARGIVLSGKLRRSEISREEYDRLMRGR